jgi:diacylglycerol kinase
MSLAIWLRLDRVRVMVVFLSLALVWVAELLNSAVEAVVDLVTPRARKDMAKVAKDVAASATFVATITATITSMVMILPSLFQRLLSFFSSQETGNPDS